MTNREKLDLYEKSLCCATCMARNNFSFDAIDSYKCYENGINCKEEQKKNFDWLMEDEKCQGEQAKPQVDWRKVPVDTLIEVSSNLNFNSPVKRYFAKYENGIIYTWNDGRTSLTAYNEEDIKDWFCARLVEE